MSTVYIDDVAYEFDQPEGLLQFCSDNGIEVPHFCYHPAMSVPANCRQCLVNVGTPSRDRATGDLQLDDDGKPVIRFFPKLQTSCSMQISDGMVVQTHRTSDLVARAQKDTLEFLLINHPLDCPICDQAGHCPLQNQAYKYGPEGSRFEFEKVHKPKKITLGPRVTLDGERCINCTRCTRFTAEVSKSHQLTITQRGVNNYPLTPPGVEFDDPYSMNVIDICPVGALTSTDFRFKARVWEMSKTPSISGYGSKGINVDYWVRNNQIMRITPRTNMDVNEFWMPDEERLAYMHFNENRPQSGPSAKKKSISWEEASQRVGKILKKADASSIQFIGSAMATVEDNYLLTKLAASLGANAPVFVSHDGEGDADDWLLTSDRSANRKGCEALGMKEAKSASLKKDIKEGKISVLYVMEEDVIGTGLLDKEDLSGLKLVLHYHNTTNQSLAVADVAMPAAMIVETSGTLVNEDGIAQLVRPALKIKHSNTSLMMGMGANRLNSHGTPFDNWHDESNIIDCKPSWDILQDVSAEAGGAMNFKSPRAIMDELARENENFAGVTYENMGLTGCKLESVAETA